MSTRALHPASLFLRRNLALASLSVQPDFVPVDLPEGMNARGTGAARLSPGETLPSRHDA